MEGVKEKIDCMQQNTIPLSMLAVMKISPCIQNVQLEIINRFFKCMMCHSLNSEPVCIGNCCKKVLGCGNYLEKWFINNNCWADNDNVETNEVLTTAFDELLGKTRSLIDVVRSVLPFCLPNSKITKYVVLFCSRTTNLKFCLK